MAVKENSKSDTIITGTSKADSILNYGDNVSINGGNGNNVIENQGPPTIEDGSISWSELNHNVTIETGTGKDFISNFYAEKTKINSGAGNDTVYNGRYGDSATIDTGDGNDVVYGYNANKMLEIVGNYETSTVGNDVLIKVGKGSILLKDAEDETVNISGNILKEGTEGNDNINNFFVGATINALGGNDAIWNSEDNVLIIGGKGNDSIENSSMNSVTLYGGDGNDTISNNWADNVSINGGSGDDYIDNGGSNVTINGGAGNDTIENSKAYYEEGVLFQYSSGDGNDIIKGFRADSTLSIGGGEYSTTKSGDDVIVTVGKGKITIVGGADLDELNIAGKKKVVTTLTLTNSDKTPVTIDAAIKTVNASKRTKAVKVTGNALANTITGGSKNDSLYGGKGNDSIVGNAGNDKLYGQTGNDILKGGAGNDSLWGGAGNDTFIYASGESKDIIYGFENNDLLKITGAFSASYSKSKGEIYFKVGTTKNAITLSDFSASSFNINGTNYKISGTKLVKK